MSIVIGDTIQDILLETQTVGVRVSNDDIILGYKRANSYFNSTYKMPTTERTADLLVFPGVYEYPPMTDFLGWYEPQRPYGNTSPWFMNTSQNELTHTYAGNQMAFKFDRENLFLLISYNNSQSFQGNSSDGNTSNLIVNACDSLTSNGTWSVSGDGSNLILDTQIFVQGSGSLRFQIINSSGTATLTCVSQTAIDLTQMIQQGFFFLSLDCPMTNTTALGSVKLRLGSTAGLATDYYEFASSTWYRGDSIKNGFNQVGFNALNATTSGSPNVQNLIYMTVTIQNATDGSNTGIYRLDNIFAALPTYFQLPYYSKYNIKASDGTYKQNPTSTDDTILCPEDCNEAFIYKTLEHISFYNLKSLTLPAYFGSLLAPFENQLKIKYPSQEKKMSTQTYRSRNQF